MLSSRDSPVIVDVPVADGDRRGKSWFKSKKQELSDSENYGFCYKTHGKVKYY